MQVKYDAEPQNTIYNALIAFCLLVDDYNSLRREIIESWKRYRQGEFGFVSVSLMTNTALDLARRRKKRKPMFEPFGDPNGVLRQYYLSLCKKNGEDPVYKEESDDQMNICMYNAAETIVFSSYVYLEHLMLSFGPLFFWDGENRWSCGEQSGPVVV